MRNKLLVGLVVWFSILVGNSSGAWADYAGSAATAAQWLVTRQNIDGSWGNDDTIKPLYTSEAVLAFHDLYRLTPGYYRGITWLENHGSANLDYRARRILALVTHGDSLADDFEVVTASRDNDSSSQPVTSGWGLSAFYASDVLDTSLILSAYNQAGQTPDALEDILSYLLHAQLTAPDCALPGADSCCLAACSYLMEGEHFEAVYGANDTLQAKYLRGVVDEIVNGYLCDDEGMPTNYTFHHA